MCAPVPATILLRAKRPGLRASEETPFLIDIDRTLRLHFSAAGSSAGAAVQAAVTLAGELGPGKRIATVIPDSAEPYLSKKILEGGE